MREAKQHTSWNDPDPAYECRVLDLARACLSDAALVAQVKELLADHAAEITATTLRPRLLQLTLPGVPDVYQGMRVARPSPSSTPTTGGRSRFALAVGRRP